MVYTYFESQKLSHPMSLVPNRTPWALGKTLAGKKMPAGTRLGTAALGGRVPQVGNPCSNINNVW